MFYADSNTEIRSFAFKCGIFLRKSKMEIKACSAFFFWIRGTSIFTLLGEFVSRILPVRGLVIFSPWHRRVLFNAIYSVYFVLFFLFFSNSYLSMSYWRRRKGHRGPRIGEFATAKINHSPPPRKQILRKSIGKIIVACPESGSFGTSRNSFVKSTFIPCRYVDP